MASTLGVQFEAEVVAEIRNLGYGVTEQPDQVPSRKSWLDRLNELLPGGPRYRPDILVERGDRFALIEAKTSPLLQGSVVQSVRYSNHFNAEVVLCVSDDVWPQVSESVKMFAHDNGVHLCSKSSLGKVLKEVLG